MVTDANNSVYLDQIGFLLDTFVRSEAGTVMVVLRHMQRMFGPSSRSERGA
jgi:hypothetical protein